jgi:cholesterol transport system auxiliary component
MIRPALAAVTVLILALGLAGCITLFPKEKPAQLYRFDVSLPPAPAASGAPFAVRVGAVDFDPAASNDRLLTVNGDQVAYLDGARWEAQAGELFGEAVEHGFSSAGGRARLVQLGPAKAEFRLTLQVSRFEAEYLNGPSAAPTIVVRLRATLERQSDLSVVGEKEFDATAPASDNRAGPIVAAYEAATTQVVGALVAWINQPAGG